MPLIRRVGRYDSEEKPIDGHLFEAALELYLQEHITLIQISNVLDLNAGEETQLADFKTEFDSRNFSGKLAYFLDVIAAVTGLQLKVLSEEKFRSVLSLPEKNTTTTTTTTP